MGPCLSCLGLNRQHLDSDQAERTHLLYNDPYNPSGYGAAASTNRALRAQIPTEGPAQHEQVDPEQLKRERQALERVCVRMAGKLIDISHHTVSSQGQLQDQQASQSRVENESVMDYARHLRDTFSPAEFPARAYQGELSRMSRRGSNCESAEGSEDENDAENERRDLRREEEAWIREIMERDTVGRRWDPGIVRESEGARKLTFDFDSGVLDGDSGTI